MRPGWKKRELLKTGFKTGRKVKAERSSSRFEDKGPCVALGDTHSVAAVTHSLSQAASQPTKQ